MAELLLELRFQPLGDAWPATLADRLRDELVRALRRAGLPPRTAASTFTSRRLVVILQGLPSRSANRRREELGPSVAEAFDEGGAPRAALAHFLEQVPVLRHDLERTQREGTEYVVARWQEEGRAAAAILVHLLREAIEDLLLDPDGAPRSASSLRPLLGVLAVFDAEMVPFEVCGIRSGDSTIGHRVRSPRAFRVRGAEEYVRKLLRRGVEIRFRKRRQKLLSQLQTLATEARGRLVSDDQLLDRVATRAEAPEAVYWPLPPEFEDLPRGVVVEVLRDRQMAFAVDSPDGELLGFGAMVESTPAARARVERGFALASRSHLVDARNLYDRDRAVPLHHRRRELERAVDDGGTSRLAERLGRIEQITSALAHEVGEPGDWEHLAEAVPLLKADLGSRLVGELPSLRGVLGAHLARREGYAETVCRAIEDHRLPNRRDPRLPRDLLGVGLAIADRTESLTARLAGPRAESSPRVTTDRVDEDALALAQLLFETAILVDFDFVVARAARGVGPSAEDLVRAVRSHLTDALSRYLLAAGYREEEIDATLPLASGRIWRLPRRLGLLVRLRDDETLRRAARLSRRLESMLEDREPGAIDEGLLREEAERALWQTLCEIRDALEGGIDEEDPDVWLVTARRWVEAVDHFLQSVLVLEGESAVQENRVALLAAALRPVSRKIRFAALVDDVAEAVD